jgi:hypothetical protein
LWRLAKPEETQTRRISGGVLTVERVLARIAVAQDASARAFGVGLAFSTHWTKSN